jgi:UDP-N-acetylglucosamine--N-acetylmuramyl-(pentapeptide) pyrophosphoryl-undecaprenol N-acetylglucosamine transferase
MLMLALLQSLVIMIRYKPDAVIGLGGFVSGPGGIAAWLLRIPLYIHEQNAIAGLTNRLLAPLARTVMLGFPGALQGTRVVTTGNPVRTEIRKLESPVTRFASRQHKPLRLLVLGGSLGAMALNELLPEVLVSLPEHVQVDVWHQTGATHIEVTRELYARHQLREVRVDAYINDMAAAYSWADMVLCRAGASTIGEICAAGIASILVPYPHAVDDHQTANARYLSDAGAAILIPQASLSAVMISDLLSGFFRERKTLLDMAMIAKSKAFPDATTKIGNICMGVSHA